MNDPIMRRQLESCEKQRGEEKLGRIRRKLEAVWKKAADTFGAPCITLPDVLGKAGQNSCFGPPSCHYNLMGFIKSIKETP